MSKTVFKIFYTILALHQERESPLDGIKVIILCFKNIDSVFDIFSILGE